MRFFLLDHNIWDSAKVRPLEKDVGAAARHLSSFGGNLDTRENPNQHGILPELLALTHYSQPATRNLLPNFVLALMSIFKSI